MGLANFVVIIRLSFIKIINIFYKSTFQDSNQL
jgi:hypothetical protein